MLSTSKKQTFSELYSAGNRAHLLCDLRKPTLSSASGTYIISRTPTQPRLSPSHHFLFHNPSLGFYSPNPVACAALALLEFITVNGTAHFSDTLSMAAANGPELLVLLINSKFLCFSSGSRFQHQAYLDPCTGTGRDWQYARGEATGRQQAFFINFKMDIMALIVENILRTGTVGLVCHKVISEQTQTIISVS